MAQFFNENLPPEEYRTLPATMLHFDKWECRDPRDKVFGLLGMCNRDTRAMVHVDYRKTKIEVFQALLKSGVYKKTSIDRLYAAVEIMGIDIGDIKSNALLGEQFLTVRIPLYAAGTIYGIERLDSDAAAPANVLLIQVKNAQSWTTSLELATNLSVHCLQDGIECLKMPYYDGEIYFAFRGKGNGGPSGEEYLGQMFVPHEDALLDTRFPPSMQAGVCQEQWTFELELETGWSWLKPSSQTVCHILEIVSIAHAGRTKDLGDFPDAGNAQQPESALFPFLDH